jgi:negative regulator of sigma E activity
MIKMKKSDRFELLSAYLDEEATFAERKQVEQWLASDIAFKRLYVRLLKLKQGMRSIPIPAPQQSPEVTVNQVFAHLRRRSRLFWVVGGATVTACLIGTISGLFPINQSPNLQMAQKPAAKPIPVAKKQPAVIVSPLMVAINNPVMEIPKTEVATPQKPAVKSSHHRPDSEKEYN